MRRDDEKDGAARHERDDSTSCSPGLVAAVEVNLVA